MPQSHIFISYCKEDRDLVGKLKDQLISHGEKVWWDQDILPGLDWQLAIRTAMKEAKAVIICFSKATETRYKSGMFPELYDAIKEYKTFSPGEIYLIPVRLSKSAIPDIEISGSLTLQNIQYIDLFPKKKFSENFKKLMASIKMVSGC